MILLANSFSAGGARDISQRRAIVFAFFSSRRQVQAYQRAFCFVRVVWLRRLEGAIAGARLRDQPRRPGRNELDHDIHQWHAAFVPDDVHVVGWFEEGRPSRNHVWRTSGVITLVEGRGSGLDDDKARPQVSVPAE